MRTSHSTAFDVRGVIEGFYGTPWTHEERLDMVSFIAARGMNTFIYAPKDDPLLRRDWRVPFGPDRHEDLVELRQRCRSLGLRLVVAISPGLTIRYSDPGDVDALAAKIESAYDLGADGVGLLLDDIPARLQHPGDIATFPSLAVAHAGLVSTVVERVRRRRPGAWVVVCPTTYCGYGDEPDLVELANGIPADVDLFWTGRAICSATLDLHDAEVFTAATGRPPLYWDNYPVNDVAMVYEAHLGPYRGRDARLAAASRGVVVNPMDRPESSKIALATIADYLADPTGYDPELSWRRAITEVVSGRPPGATPDDPIIRADVEAFAAYADNVRYSCLSPADAPTVCAVLEDLSFAAATGSAHQLEVAAATVTSTGRRLAEAVRRVTGARFANRKLAEEQAPWLAKAAEGAQALIDLGTAAAGDTGELVAVAARHRGALAQNRYRVFGDALEMALDEFAQTTDPFDVAGRPRDLHLEKGLS